MSGLPDFHFTLQNEIYEALSSLEDFTILERNKTKESTLSTLVQGETSESKCEKLL